MSLSSERLAVRLSSDRWSSSDPGGDEGKESIIITNDFEDVKIVTIEIPQLKGIKGASKTGKARFHEATADQLQGLWAEGARLHSFQRAKGNLVANG